VRIRSPRYIRSRTDSPRSSAGPRLCRVRNARLQNACSEIPQHRADSTSANATAAGRRNRKRSRSKTRPLPTVTAGANSTTGKNIASVPALNPEANNSIMSVNALASAAREVRLPEVDWNPSAGFCRQARTRAQSRCGVARGGLSMPLDRRCRGQAFLARAFLYRRVRRHVRRQLSKIAISPRRSVL
jgi:hypothetical protein